MPNFSIPLSGLAADSVALNTIGNNLANLNTTAFKEQSTEFENLFYQQIGANGSGDVLQLGAGVKVQETPTNYNQGSINPDGVATHLALAGDGFFVVQQQGVQSLTRAGNFQLDNQGNLITAEGASVMGYNAQNGVVGAGGSLVAMKLPIGTTEAAEATQNVSLTANLNAGTQVGQTFTTSLGIYDSLGTQHLLNFTFTKTAAGSWDYTIALPPGDETGTPVNNQGTLTFDSSGNLTAPAGNVAGVSLPGLADGAADLTFNFNLYDSNNKPLIAQTSSASAVNSNSADGYKSGIYTGFTADAAGILTANFSNGQQVNVGQVAVATVANEQGLTVVGNNNFMTTAASGQINAGVAETGSRGSITPDALELSNVDISTEFANLIVAQRAFEANTKTVTTFDTVTQDTIALIR